MGNRAFFVAVIFIFIGLWNSPSEAFDIQYHGEAGFFVGKPMVYMITNDSSGEDGSGREGTFTFGQDRTVIDGDEYFDTVFDYPDGPAHFYFGLNHTDRFMTQKGFEVGATAVSITPAVKALQYPLSEGDNWSESNIELEATNIELPGLGALPALAVNDTSTQTNVTSETISVIAGTFDSLLVETTYTGSLLGIPVSLIQRTWLNRDNVALKRSFDFVFFSAVLPVYEIELSKLTLTPWDVNWDGFVNALDVVLVARQYGDLIDEPMVRSPDANGDGVVGINDLAMVGAHLGKNIPLQAPAKFLNNDLLEHFRNVYAAAREQSYQLRADERIGLERSLNVLEMILSDPEQPAQNMLLQSFPNPCNPEVWIPYSLANDEIVTIKIYSISGQLVRELALGHRPAGTHISRSQAAYWDGRNTQGEMAASGIYFYTIRAGDFAATRRMLMLK